MIEINVDMGERGYRHPEDLELLHHVDRVNLALGGHAGDARTAMDFKVKAEALGVKVSLHPSYPDRKNFGRKVMELPIVELLQALDQQREVLPEVKSVKFHGALYNQAWVDDVLAEVLARWCVDAGLKEILCPPGSAQEKWAHDIGLVVIREGFADRAYTLKESGKVVLLPRSSGMAVLDNGRAYDQVRMAVIEGKVQLRGEIEKWARGAWDSWCLHSDREGALDLAKKLKEWKRES